MRVAMHAQSRRFHHQTLKWYGAVCHWPPLQAGVGFEGAEVVGVRGLDNRGPSQTVGTLMSARPLLAFGLLCGDTGSMR